MASADKGGGGRLAPRRIDDRSVGFVVAGASTVAARWMLDAIRQQPPAPGSEDVAGAYIVGVFSHNLAQARRFADLHGIPQASDDLSSLLQKPEVRCVYVGSQPRHHADSVELALMADKHVLCEPPLACTCDVVEHLQRMAEHRGLVLALNYTWRASAAVRMLRELLEEDAVGEVLGARIQNTAFLVPHQQTWRLQPGGGGVLVDRTLRDVDLIRFLFEIPVRTVYGRSTQQILGRGPGDDGVVEELLGYVGLAGGLFIQVHDSFVLPHTPTTIEIFGATGTLRAERCAVEDRNSAVTLFRSGHERPIPLTPIQPYRAVVGRFLAAMRGETPPLTSARDEHHNLVALSAFADSLRQGQAATVAGTMRGAIVPRTRVC